MAIYERVSKDEVLTVQQAAAELHLSPPRVYQYIAAGRLRALRKNGRLYLDRLEWERWKQDYLKRREVEISEENRRLSRIRT